MIPEQVYLYMEYEDFKDKYLAGQMVYDSILNEKQSLFERTQPNAVAFDNDRVDGGEYKNTFEEYLSAKEAKRIDERLLEAKDILEHRFTLLQSKETELRLSKNTYDIVYRMYYLDHCRVNMIANVMHYSRSQVHRYTRKIKRYIKMRHNATL